MYFIHIPFCNTRYSNLHFDKVYVVEVGLTVNRYVNGKIYLIYRMV